VATGVGCRSIRETDRSNTCTPVFIGPPPAVGRGVHVGVEPELWSLLDRWLARPVLRGRLVAVTVFTKRLEVRLLERMPAVGDALDMVDLENLELGHAVCTPAAPELIGGVRPLLREVVCLPVCSFRLFLRETALLAGVVVAFENGLANAVPHEHPLDGLLRSAYSADSSSSDGRPRRTRYRHGTSERRPSGTACPSPSGGPSGGCSWLASVRIRDDPAGVPRPDYEVTFLFPVFRERLGNLSEHTHGRVERDAACQLACLGSM